MAMAMDNQQRYGGITFENMNYTSAPQFNHPWPTSTTSPANHGIYASSQHNMHHNLSLDVKPIPQHNMNHNLSLDVKPIPQHNMNHNLSLDVKPIPQHRRQSGNMACSYATVPITSTSTGNSIEAYSPHQLLPTSQDLLNTSRSVSSAYDSSYATSHSPGSAPPTQSSYPSNSASYDSMGYAAAPVRAPYAMHQHEGPRRLSTSNHPNEHRGYMETIDPNRGMMSMNQSASPRNYYGPPPRVRGSGDSYTYQAPTNHSNASSLSSPGAYPSYYGGSVASHVGEYPAHGLPSNGSSTEAVASRTLPRPPNLISTGVPPAPQSMMSQFSSKVSSSTQKKHKCKVCDKRFTRPSSLQTHMYSHTGEKPFSCEVEGCGRNFSVVSNLRRHRKVHKGEARSEAESEEHQPDE
ncbi:hypothetical protein K3495_g5928 [Podosphaera aphanis]|nr:hypothetical protein K3495_g5928 [Podosphaera aphanis]